MTLLILGGFAALLDWSAFFAEFAHLNLLYVPIYLLLIAVTFWIRALRWKYLLPTDNQIDQRTLFDSFSIGMLGTFLLPFRAGEIIRAWTLRRWRGVPFAVGFASVIAERAFDVLSLLTIFGICLIRVEGAPPELITAAGVLGGVAVGIIVVMLLCYFYSEGVLSIAQALIRSIFRGRASEHQVKIEAIVVELVSGFRAISTPRELVLVVFLSLGIWLIFGLAAQAGLWCFGEFPSVWVGITTNVVVALAIAIPSAPGFLGVFQFGCWLALSGMFGYPKEFSVAFAIVTHSLQFALVVLIGGLVLRRTGLSIGDLRKHQYDTPPLPA